MPARQFVYTCAGCSKEYPTLAAMMFDSIRRWEPEGNWDFGIITESRWLADISGCLPPGTQISLTDMPTPYAAAVPKLSPAAHFNLAGYERILFLDADILVGALLDALSAVDKPGRIYIFREGKMASPNYKGTDWKALWPKGQPEREAPGFSSGAFAFVNCPESLSVLEEAARLCVPGQGCLEQPALNRVLYERKAAEWELFSKILTVRPKATNPYPINHFCGGIGCGPSKYFQMKQFLADLQ